MTKSDERYYVLVYWYSHIRICRISTPERHPNARPAAIHSFLDLGFDYAFAWLAVAFSKTTSCNYTVLHARCSLCGLNAGAWKAKG